MTFNDYCTLLRRLRQLKEYRQTPETRSQTAYLQGELYTFMHSEPLQFKRYEDLLRAEKRIYMGDMGEE